MLPKVRIKDIVCNYTYSNSVGFLQENLSGEGKKKPKYQ
jgi:hypothetical protein